METIHFPRGRENKTRRGQAFLTGQSHGMMVCSTWKTQLMIGIKNETEQGVSGLTTRTKDSTFSSVCES